MTGLCERLTSLKLWEYQRHYRVDVLAFVGDVLRQLCEEVERPEDLEVAGYAAEEVFAGRFGEAMGWMLFGAVDDLAG